MNWADWLIVAIIGISSLISVARGFVKEAISLAIWAAAFFVAVAFHEQLAVLLLSMIDSATIRYVLAFVLLFVITLIVGAMINHLMAELVKITGLSGTDRILGIAFGMARGLLIIMAILILLPMAVPVVQDRWWQDSLLIPQLLLMEQWCRDTFTLIVGVIRDIM